MAMFATVAPAFAEGETPSVTDESAAALTTKNYVDTGLKYVYRVADAAQTAADDAATAATNAASAAADAATAAATAQTAADAAQEDVDTLSGTVNTLSGTVAGHTEAITELQNRTYTDNNTTYSEGTGITIDETNGNAISVTGLENTKTVANANKKYIYQNGVLTELEVENTWNPAFLTQQ